MYLPKSELLLFSIRITEGFRLRKYYIVPSKIRTPRNLNAYCLVFGLRRGSDCGCTLQNPNTFVVRTPTVVLLCTRTLNSRCSDYGKVQMIEAVPGTLQNPNTYLLFGVQMTEVLQCTLQKSEPLHYLNIYCLVFGLRRRSDTKFLLYNAIK